MNNIEVLVGAAVLAALAGSFIWWRSYQAKQLLISFANGAPDPTDPMDVSGWRLGPIVYGVNRSFGVPLVPTPNPGSPGWFFDIPVGDGSPTSGQVHGASFNHGPLTGRKQIRARFRIDLPDGVAIVPQTAPAPAPAMVTLLFQREGDNWTAAGAFEAYRWYYPVGQLCPVTAGEHELIAPLDGDWSAIMTSTTASNPAGFQSAIADAQAVMIGFGGGSGLEHGFYASGPGARFTLLEFAVE